MRNGQKAHAGSQQRWSPQEPESADAGLRVERTGREDPRHRLAHRGEIHPACARCAELRRPGGGRELLSARRALFPPDRRRAGTVPPENPYYNRSRSRARRRARRSRRQLRRRRRRQPPYMGQNEPSYAPQPPAQQAQPYLPRDAQPFPPRDQQHRIAPQPQPYAQPSVQGGNVRSRTPMRCRRSSPAAASRSRMPADPSQGNGPNGYEQGDRGQDRFGHRRRRRHRGGGYRPDRPENFGNTNPQGAAPQPIRATAAMSRASRIDDFRDSRMTGLVRPFTRMTSVMRTRSRRRATAPAPARAPAPAAPLSRRTGIAR